VRFLDYDLDGRQDLAVANGHIEPEIGDVQREIAYAQPAQLFWQDDAGHFVEAAARAGAPFSEPVVGRGLAVADADGDGDPDLLMTENGGAARLLRNEAIGPQSRATRSAVVLRLEGAPPNRDALGAVVTVVAGPLRQRAMVRTGSSYLSQSSLALTFGLNGAERVDAVEGVWPNGSEESLAAGLDAGYAYRVVQGRGVESRRSLGR